jgi:hypothetical protein
LLKAFERRILNPQLRRLKPWRHAVYGDIGVNYCDHLDGGGRTSGMEDALARVTLVHYQQI